MIANRELRVEDYIAMARRRLGWFLVPAILGPLIGYLSSFAVTPQYVSIALLLVEGQVVPTGYVSPIVTQHVSDRMITIQQNVLSRARLEPVVTRLGLVRKGKTIDDIVDQIRQSVSVNPYRRAGGGEEGATNDVSGFHVAYASDNPRDAQEVCAEVASLLIAENLELREQVARSTTDFLSRELEQSKHNLDEMETKLSQFKLQHFGRMPGDTETNLRLLESMNSQLDASSRAIGRMQEDKSHTEAILDKEMAAWKSAQAAPIFPSLRQQLLQLQNQLVLLKLRYTDDFPDVVKAKHEIQELQAKLREINSQADASDALKDASVPREGARLEPPEIAGLHEQIYRQEKAIERATEGQKRLQDRIDVFRSRLAVDPDVEEEWKQLTRDNSTAHNIYNTLLTNKSNAEIQTELEHSQEGEQLRLMDPASLPHTPSAPIRWRFAVYGLGGGLGLGAMIALVLEFQDKAIRNEADVLAALELPMLGSVSWIGIDGNGNGDGRNWKDRLRRPFTPRLKEKEEEKAANS